MTDHERMWLGLIPVFLIIGFAVLMIVIGKGR